MEVLKNHPTKTNKLSYKGKVMNHTKTVGFLQNIDNASDIVPITNSKTVVIGRAGEPLDATRESVHVDHHVNGDKGVSRVHCMIEAFRHEAFVYDLDSMNGTWVNKVNVVRADNIRHARLDDQAILCVGSTKYRYYETFWAGEQIPAPAYNNKPDVRYG